MSINDTIVDGTTFDEKTTDKMVFDKAASCENDTAPFLIGWLVKILAICRFESVNNDICCHDFVPR